MDYIFLTHKSPQEFLFFAKVTHKNEPTTRTATKSGRSFVSYSMYVQVNEAVKFMENFEGFIPPKDRTSMSFLVNLKEDMYNKIEKDMILLIKGGLSSYKNDEGEELFKIVPTQINFYNSSASTSNELLNRFKMKMGSIDDDDDISEDVKEVKKGSLFMTSNDDEDEE